MPILDYQHRAETAKKTLLARQDITTANKTTLNSFLDRYNVSAARLNIFVKHIVFLLAGTKNIRQDMQNRALINQLFQKLRKDLSINYYSTVVNCSKAFVRWLNDGDMPKGFKDITSISKKKQKRDLKAEDMITWEDCLKLIATAKTTQLKAIISTPSRL